MKLEALHGLSHQFQWMIVLILPAGLFALFARNRRFVRAAASVSAALAAIGFSSILLDAFSSAKISADRSTCNHQLRAMGMAVNMYLSDNDVTMPPASRWTAAIDSRLKWESPDEGFNCRSANTPFSYAFNATLDRKSMMGVIEQAELILAFDAAVNTLDAAGDSRILERRHSGGANVVFCDGHTKWVNPHSEKLLRWNP